MTGIGLGQSRVRAVKGRVAKGQDGKSWGNERGWAARAPREPRAPNL